MAFQEVECQTVGDTAEPSGERSLVRLISVDMTESPQEGILSQFLSIHHVGHLAHYHRKDTLSIATDHLRLSLAPPLSDGLHDFCLCQSTRFLSHFYSLYDNYNEISRSLLQKYLKLQKLPSAEPISGRRG